MASSKTWSTRPLKDCAVWYSGGTPNKATPHYWGGTIPWITAKSITGFFIAESQDHVTPDGARNGTRLVPPNTILFIVRGMSLKSEFRMGITTRPVTFNQDLKALVAVEEVIPAFLAYAIKAKTDEILGLVGEAGHGTGVLPTDRIQSLEIPIPPPPEQRAIAHVLSALDEKIELNRQTSETLEAMARTLFKSWFVEFEPVWAKSEGRRPAGMDAETAKLFPNAFKHSYLGEIPRQWPLITLGDCVALQRGTTYQSALLGHPGPILLGLASIRRDGGFRADSLRTYGGESPEKLLLRPGELYVSLKDVTQSGDLLGSVARLPNGVALGRVTQDTVKLVHAGTSVPGEYIYWLLQTPRYREYCRGRAMGTTNLSLSREDFLAYKFALPASDILARLLPNIERMSKRMEELGEESKTLTALRDTLLPKLLSGEIRIKDAEKLASDAL